MDIFIYILWALSSQVFSSSRLTQFRYWDWNHLIPIHPCSFIIHLSQFDVFHFALCIFFPKCRRK